MLVGSASFFNELETKNELCSLGLFHFLTSLKPEMNYTRYVGFIFKGA